MITVSDAWKDIQQRFLIPETQIEIECGIIDDEARRVGTITGTDEATFSNAQNVFGNVIDPPKYATLELNLWSLDGSFTVLSSATSNANTGYVSNIASTGSITARFSPARNMAVSGVTITWSEKIGEYARVFSIIAKNGTNVVAETTVTDNKLSVTDVFLPMENYDSINVVVHDWSLPNRRARIEKMVIGHILKFDKKDLLGFTHEQDGDLLSGKMPKYSIEFSLDNSDGRWDPNNPTGMAQYLSERQRITVRYGLDIGDAIEWINAGIFYLSEWYAPPNGLETRFVARDAFEFLLGSDMKGYSKTGTLKDIVSGVTAGLLPANMTINTNALANTSSRTLKVEDNISSAEIVQKCANANCCIIRYGRNGSLNIESLNLTPTDYQIPLALSYSYPEITLSKPLKSVSVDYGAKDANGDSVLYNYPVANAGEVQSVDNDYIYNATQAALVAQWVANILKTRKTISGNFRSDPRLDLYDIVKVEDKYGRLLTVVITNIKYTFNGAFSGTYTGRIMEV